MQELKAYGSVQLPSDVINYLQQLDYELAGLRVLHTHAMNAGLSEDKIKSIREEHQEKFKEYQLAKAEVYETFGKNYRDCKRWWVDFSKEVMYFAR